MQEYRDPHNCTGSCEYPEDGCYACTNPEYFFCEKNNVSVCMHPALECDGHPQCDDAEDENLDKCFQKYKEREIITNHATLKCPSRNYPEMITLATVCDGIMECLDDEDEPASCESISPKWFLISKLIIVLLYISINSTKIFYKPKKVREVSRRSILRVRRLLRNYANNHEERNFYDLLNSFLMFVKFTKDRIEKKWICLNYYILEEQKHQQHDAEIFCCLHNNLEPVVCEMVIDSNFPGIMEKYCSKITTFLDNLNRNEKYKKAMYHISKIGGLLGHYSDIFKDSFLLYTICNINGGIKPLLDFPTKFTSVVIFLSGASIIFPLLISTIHLAKNNAKMIYTSIKSKVSKTKLLFLKVGVILLAVVNPILLQNSYETIKEKTREHAKQLNTTRLSKLRKKLMKTKRQFVDFVRIDLALECTYQLFGETILILLSTTETSTTGGLENFFKKDSFAGLSLSLFLTLYIIWSLKTCILLHLKSVGTEKGFLPFTAKLTVVIWGTISYAKRIMSLVAFFIPSLGLFNILQHWQAEQIPFFVRKYLRKGPSDILELYNTTENVLWSEIDRWNYADPSNPSPPNYTLYTGLTLRQSFMVFIGILVMQFLAILIVKTFTVNDFWRRSHFNKFVHILENMNIATPWQDWDHDKCSVEQHKMKHRRVNIEMMVIMVVNFLICLLMICPLFFTGLLKHLDS